MATLSVREDTEDHYCCDCSMSQCFGKGWLFLRNSTCTFLVTQGRNKGSYPHNMFMEALFAIVQNWGTGFRTAKLKCSLSEEWGNKCEVSVQRKTV
jgi:hypothetical protein